MKLKKKEVEKIGKWESKYGQIIWGTNPTVNPAGSHITFYSERDVVKGDKHGKMWVKDLWGGKEYPVYDKGVGNVKGWINDTTLILNSFETVAIDILSGENVILLDDNRDIGLVIDNIVYQVETGLLVIQNIESGEKNKLTHPLLHQTGTYKGHGSLIAIQNRLKDTELVFTVLLYNIDENIWKNVTSGDDYYLDDFFWSDTGTLVVLTSEKGTTNEVTHHIKMN